MFLHFSYLGVDLRAKPTVDNINNKLQWEKWLNCISTVMMDLWPLAFNSTVNLVPHLGMNKRWAWRFFFLCFYRHIAIYRINWMWLSYLHHVRAGEEVGPRSRVVVMIQNTCSRVSYFQWHRYWRSMLYDDRNNNNNKKKYLQQFTIRFQRQVLQQHQ